MDRITLELCSVFHEPVNMPVDEVSVPGMAGVFTVLPGHTPLLTSLRHGVVAVALPDGETAYFAVHGGFCEVAADKVTILADVMESHGEIDAERAEAALRRAEERLEKPDASIDVARAVASMARARARLDAHSLGS